MYLILSYLIYAHWNKSVVLYIGTPTEQRTVQQRREHKDKKEDKDSCIGPQEFVVGYSKAPKQLQSSARPIYVILTP